MTVYLMPVANKLYMFRKDEEITDDLHMLTSFHTVFDAH